MPVVDALDIVELLGREHAELRATLRRLDRGGLDERWATYSRFAALLIRHEVAEELVVYPALVELDGGMDVVASRLQDQTGIERLLLDLDQQAFESPEFRRESVRLGVEVLDHLDKEDAHVLPLLQERLGALGRADLGRQFLEVERLAPALEPATPHRPPTRPTVVPLTSAVSTWMRDSVAYNSIAS